MLKYSISSVYFIHACSFLVTNVSIVTQVRCTKLYHYLHHGFLHKIILVIIPASTILKPNYCVSCVVRRINAEK